LKSVLKYTDYREFLRDHATHKRRKNPRWSIGLWARKLKLGSTTSLNMILNGQRHPGDTISERLVDYFGFEPRERDYFLDLIEFAKVKKTGTNRTRLKHLLADDLKKLASGKAPKKLNQKTFLAISHWYCYAIRQMTLLKDFDGTPAAIAKRLQFPVTESELTNAIDTLLDVGLLKKSANGKIKRVSKFVKTDDDIASEGLKRFHEAMIANAAKSIRQFDVNDREISGLTLAVRREQMPEAKRLIRRFIQDFESLGQAEDADQVCQLNIQFFPLAR